MDGRTVDHVFAGSHHHVHLNACRSPFGDRSHGTDNGSTAAHVEFHHVALGATHFEVVTAGVKRESFAHEGQPSFDLTTWFVDQMDEFGFEVRALTH